MQQSPIPVNIPSCTIETDIRGTREEVFQYISSGSVLPDWLKKCGPVSGATKTEIVKGPYSFVGASRTVYLTDGTNITEQLLEYQPNSYYSYSVTGIRDILRHLTSTGYGQWWFDETNGLTHVKWIYRFVPKNFFARLGLSLFLSLFYKKFMRRCLTLAKQQIEQKKFADTRSHSN